MTIEELRRERDRLDAEIAKAEACQKRLGAERWARVQELYEVIEIVQHCGSDYDGTVGKIVERIAEIEAEVGHEARRCNQTMYEHNRGAVCNLGYGHSGPCSWASKEG